VNLSRKIVVSRCGLPLVELRLFSPSMQLPDNNGEKECVEEVPELKEKELKDRTIKIKGHSSSRNSQPKSPRNSEQSQKHGHTKKHTDENEHKKETSPRKVKAETENNETKERSDVIYTSPRRNLSPQTEELLTLEQEFTARTIEKKSCRKDGFNGS